MSTRPLLKRSDLHEYQVRTIRFIVDTDNAGLWLDMGMGKTTSTLTAIDDLFAQFAVGRPLIVGPLRVVKNTWPKEVERWEHLKHLTTCMIRGTPAERIDQLINDRADIHLINRELYEWLVDTLDPRKRTKAIREAIKTLCAFVETDSRMTGEIATKVLQRDPVAVSEWFLGLVDGPVRLAEAVRLAGLVHVPGSLPDALDGLENARELRRMIKLAGKLPEMFENHTRLRARFAGKWPYDFVCIDEASGFKDPSSGRVKAARRALVGIKRMVELTGTPAGNGLLGLWSQIYLLDQGKRLGKTFKAYKDRYFDSDYMGYSYEPKPGAEDQIYAAIADIIMRLDASDYLTMPDLLTHDVWVELSDNVRGHYRELEREYLTQVEDEEIAVTHAAALTNKLLQCANGVVFQGDERKTVHLHDTKLDALQNIVDMHPGRPVLVSYSFQPDRDRILKQFPKAVLLDTKPETEDRWNRGEIPMLVMHPASGGHGLNIQEGSNIIAMFGLNWSLELYLQFIARLRRQGQTKDVVHLYRILARDTADTSVVDSLAGNDRTQRALLDALKTDIRKRNQ